jgi:hypothetical protein
MHRIGRQHVFVERPSDRAGKKVSIAPRVALGDGQHLEQRVEIVRGLIDVVHKYRVRQREARTQVPDGRAYRRLRCDEP